MRVDTRDFWPLKSAATSRNETEKLANASSEPAWKQCWITMPEAKASPRNHGPVAPTKRKFEDEEATEPASMKPEPEQPKRTKIIGPTLPPRVEAADSHQPKNNSDGSDSDSESESDDDYGPSLPDPSSATTTTTTSTTAELERQRAFQEAENTPAPTVTKRDDWMLRPPEQLDLSSRVDPTKLRNRKFNTGSAARRNDPAAGGGSVSTWTETADEKRKRLENEVMGVQAPSNSAGGLKVSPAESSAMKKQVQEYNVRFVYALFF